MQDDIKLRVSVETQQSEQNVENLNRKIDQTQDKVEDLNKEVGKTGTASIGAWGNAFERALDTVDQQAGSLGGNLKEVTGSLKQAVPLIKNVNSTAIKGLTGVKAAIAATGIGALILAITTIINHWEGFTKAVGISEDKFKEFKQTVVDVLKNIVSGVVGVGNVIVQFLLTPIRTVIQAFKGLGNVIKDVFTGNWKAIKDDATNALKGISDAVNKGFNIATNFQAGKEAGEKFVQGVITTFTYKKPEVEEAAGSAGKAAGKAFKDKLLETQEEARKEYLKELEKTLQEANKIVAREQNEDIRAQRLRDIKSQYEGISDEIASEILKIRENTEKDVATLNEAISGLFVTQEEGWEGQVEAFTNQIASLEAQAVVAEGALIDQSNLVLEDHALTVDKVTAQAAKSWKDYADIAAEVGFSVGSIFGDLASMEEDRIQRMVEAGEITEEQAKKQFESVKAWQYAQTWINTLAGVVAAFASPTAPFIVKAAQAASILATGVANTIKIANTKFGSPSGVGEGGGGNTGMAGATPLQVMSDITPSPTMNIPVSSEDTRVYILESDIQKSNNRVKVREDNTTW